MQMRRKADRTKMRCVNENKTISAVAEKANVNYTKVASFRISDPSSICFTVS